MALVTVSRSKWATQEALPDLRDHIDSETEHQLLREHIAVYRIDGSMFFGALLNGSSTNSRRSLTSESSSCA